MTTNTEREELKPCPFCGAGTSKIVENGKVWTGMKYGEPTSVSVQHHCERIQGQPSRMLERVGKDRASAIAAWNTRALLAEDKGGEPVARACWMDGQDPATAKPQLCDYEPTAYPQRRPLGYTRQQPSAEVLRINGGGGEAVAMSNEAKAAVKLAYGHLWHVNNEPAAPIAIYDTEKAAYAARRQLRGLLTSQERGDAINHVGLLIGRYENEGKNDAELDVDSNIAKPEQQRELAGSVALGQSLGGSTDKGTGDSQTQGKQQSVATVVGVDEYGPMLEWTTHWVELVGTKLYTAPQPQQAAPGAVLEGWQPIETAPKDVPILVTNGVLRVVIKHSVLVNDVPWPDPVGFGGYEWEWEFEYSDLTHWMPLPAAPNPQEPGA